MSPGRGRLAALKRLWQEEREHLAHSRFWAVQLLILFISGLHYIVERLGLLRGVPALYFLPEALLLVPVGYAALNFGLRGSVLTALWCTVLAMPPLSLWHTGSELVGELVLLAVVNAVAVFVGQRVDAEVRARRALQESEKRYRALFTTSAEAVLVCGPDGLLHQANEAAAELFGRPVDGLAGVSLARLLGDRAAQGILTESLSAEESELVLTSPAGSAVYVEPVWTVLAGEGGERLLQVILQDVTRHRNRREEWRTYARFVLRGQEDERRRMAQELHDEVIQSLIIILRHLDAAGAVSEVDAARLAVEKLVGVVRDFTRQLRPPVLEHLGLVATLRRLLADTASRSGLLGELDVAGRERRLPAEVELGLYRIAQEAMLNAERHARATRIAIHLKFTRQQVQLQVFDNGRGFRLAATRRSLIEQGSMGVLGMEERAALLGGRLRIDSAPGQGTTVAIDISG